MAVIVMSRNPTPIPGPPRIPNPPMPPMWPGCVPFWVLVPGSVLAAGAGADAPADGSAPTADVGSVDGDGEAPIAAATPTRTSRADPVMTPTRVAVDRPAPVVTRSRKAAPSGSVTGPATGTTGVGVSGATGSVGLMSFDPVIWTSERIARMGLESGRGFFESSEKSRQYANRSAWTWRLGRPRCRSEPSTRCIIETGPHRKTSRSAMSGTSRASDEASSGSPTPSPRGPRR